MNEKINLLQSDKAALQDQVWNLTKDAAQRDARNAGLDNENQQRKKKIEDLEVEVRSAAQKLETIKQRVEALRDDF
jgi:chromosome segregation ATPase